jgi:hypothetical protein
MRKIISFILVACIVVGAVLFVGKWRTTTPWAVGTGDIAGKSRDLAARDKRPVTAKVKSKIGGITENPTRFQNQRVTVTGRVRGAGKLASNRNIYTLSDGDDRLLVIDDKARPKEYWARTVSGVVKVIGPPIGGLRYAYLVDVREPAKFVAPTWDDLKDYFSKSANS